MRIIQINDRTFMECESYETRNSWGHKARIIKNETVIVENKIRYFNRTWEAKQYDTIASVLIDKAGKKKLLTPAEIAEFRAKI